MNGTFSTLTLMNLVWKCFCAKAYDQVHRTTPRNYLQMSVHDLASSKVLVEEMYDYSGTRSTATVTTSNRQDQYVVISKTCFSSLTSVYWPCSFPFRLLIVLSLACCQTSASGFVKGCADVLFLQLSQSPFAQKSVIFILELVEERIDIDFLGLSCVCARRAVSCHDVVGIHIHQLCNRRVHGHGRIFVTNFLVCPLLRARAFWSAVLYLPDCKAGASIIKLKLLFSLAPNRGPFQRLNKRLFANIPQQPTTTPTCLPTLKRVPLLPSSLPFT